MQYKLPLKHISISQFINVAGPKEHLSISNNAKRNIVSTEAAVQHLLKKGEVIYGVNTGIGDLCNKILHKDELQELQNNIILSHACGSAPYLDERVSRGALLLLINERSKGYSGMTAKLIQKLITFFNEGVSPLLPVRGSLGASGDLIPLAHLGLALMGKGNVYHKGKIKTSLSVLHTLKTKPYIFQPKEALSIINGTAVTSSQSAFTLFGAENLINSSNRVTATLFEILDASTAGLAPEIHELKPHSGQIIVAKLLRKYLADSKMHNRKSNKIQDPYVIRCAPQIDGAILDQIQRSKEVVEIEMNSVTDNPLLFGKGKKLKVVSGGNFHAQNVAFAMDLLSIAIATLGKVMAKRIERLINSSLSGLPPFLTYKSGLNSGFMIPHYLVTALQGENTILAHAISGESSSVSANQEDMVSMSMTSATKAYQILQNCEQILAIEILTAIQAVDILKDERSYSLDSFSNSTQMLYKKVRTSVATLKKDRWISNDIEKITKLIKAGEFIF